MVVVGAGIGGLAAALQLHRRGLQVVVVEQAAQIRELGVGLNVLPPAVAQLATLGLLHDLDAVAVRTRELRLMDRFGNLVWSELRGLDAGFRVPQLSIHRGRLQRVLLDALLRHAGQGAVLVGHHLVDVIQHPHSVEIVLLDRRLGRIVRRATDVVVAADGIHSAVRASFFPGEGRPRWNGSMIWRGATDWPVVGDGRTMLIAGGMAAKFVFYPIGPGSSPDHRLSNWGIVIAVGDPDSEPPRPEDWSRLARRADVAAHARRFALTDVDVTALAAATEEVFEYPMCDRDPLPWWSHGRVTLLGDAAHPMYPVGSNGATQAILDAECVARMLAAHPDPVEALQHYEHERLPATTQIVELNRRGGPERVIDVVESLAPDGFARVEDVIGRDELAAIVATYASAAGLTRRT